MEHDTVWTGGVREPRARGRWHNARVRAWERHGIHLDASWCSTTLDVPLSTAAVRRIRARRRVILAVEGDLLAYRFSHGHRDRARRGQVNPAFLDPAATTAQLAALLASVGEAAELVVLRLQRISPNEGLRWDRLVDLLCPWLDALPPHRRYVLESAHPSYVVPGYLECLRGRNVGHLLRHGADGSLLEIAQVPGALTAGHTVIRKGGDGGVWPACEGGDEEWELGMLTAVRQCVDRGIAAYISVPAPDRRLLRETAALMDGDLAKLSPFRKRLAA
jgi:hypothetical protein